jgi:hypothetical protein
VYLCIAAVALAAFVPGVSAFEPAVFEPTWVILPDLSSLVVADATPAVDEQPQSLLSILPSRAPPAIALS